MARIMVMLELSGRVAPVSKADPDRVFEGRVGFSADNEQPEAGVPRGVVEHVKARRAPATPGFVHVDVGDAYIYPGLVDLHSHLGYNALGLWRSESRTTPWLHRDLWPGADTYKEQVSWPAYAYLKGAPEALMAYVQVRALAGGTTAIQGWPAGNRSPVNKLIRNIDDDLGADRVRTSVMTLDPAELTRRAALMRDGAASFIYHLAEGRFDSRVAGEFDDVAGAGCLQSRLIAVHCTAVDEQGFARWAAEAAVDNDTPGGVVWSPFSNLWLYGQTTRVVDALAHGIRVALGSDWGPSGSKNLLGELKVAWVWNRQEGLGLTDRDLAVMVTAAPGDLISEAWGVQVGRLEPAAAGDAVVITRRHADPWTNLVLARETDVQLVICDGRAVYGTRDLMRRAGAGSTTAVPVAGESRHVPLQRPPTHDDPTGGKRWTWTKVVEELNTVVTDPRNAIDHAHRDLAEAIRGNDIDRLSGSTLTMLVLEPDMPGSAYAAAGPPPPGVKFTMTKPPSLTHDSSWRRSLPSDGFDRGVLAQAAGLFEDDDDS